MHARLAFYECTMSEPSWLGTPAQLYGNCMEEVRFRLQRVKTLLDSYDSQANHMESLIALESIALQFRKVIELIGLGAIAANKSAYAKIRKEFYKDWNARLIFRDINRVNPHFYPQPVGVNPGATHDAPSLLYEIGDGYLSVEETMSLYARCGALLHAENRLAPQRDMESDFRLFEQAQHRLFALLNCFWVKLLPASRRYIVLLHLNEKKQIKMAGVEVL